MITTPRELYDKVLEDYMKDDVELNSEFFDFDVRMLVKDILEAYKQLQSSINGDMVLSLADPIITQHTFDTYISGKEQPLMTLLDEEKVYEGNLKKLLLAFSEHDDEIGVYRLMDVEPTDDGRITGIKLDLCI